MKIIIQANTAEISQKELKARIPQNQMAKLKGKNLVAYTIAEEGESHPVVLGEGSQKLLWPRAVIRRVKEVVTSGTKLFNRHNSDNSHEGRNSVGEVVTSFTKEIGGKLRTIAVACMEKADALVYDICSIEAEVYEDNGIVCDVDQVTGIAVSNSKTDSPAFRNAKRMQTVQCFNDPKEELSDKSGEDKNMPITQDDLMTAPLSMIKQAVVSREVHPSQLFELSAYENDKEIGPILKDRATLQETVKTLEKDLVDNKTLLTDAQKQNSLASANDMLKERMPDGLTAKQKTFIEKRFEPANMETVDESSIDEFIKGSQKDFQDLAKMFNEGKSSTNTDEESEDFEPENNGDVSIEDAFLEE